MRMSDNPMVTLNHAIAAAMVARPGGRALRGWTSARRRPAPRRATIASTPSARTCSSGPAIATGAIAYYRRAADRTTSIAERNYLLMQAARLADVRTRRRLRLQG